VGVWSLKFGSILFPPPLSLPPPSFLPPPPAVESAFFSAAYQLTTPPSDVWIGWWQPLTCCAYPAWNHFLFPFPPPFPFFPPFLFPPPCSCIAPVFCDLLKRGWARKCYTKYQTHQTEDYDQHQHSLVKPSFFSPPSFFFLLPLSIFTPAFS